MADAPPPLVRPIGDDDRAVAFAFLRLLRDLEIPQTEAVAKINELVSGVFSVDPDVTGAVYDKGIDLSTAVSELAQLKANADPMKDEKFINFLELLKKKGYFHNCEEGTEEYDNRVKKAFDKFQARNQLSPEQLKQKGNELMSECRFTEAIQAYTKAIELDGSNHIYYANRAAAQTYVKDYRAAIMDCERAIAIEPSYVKAYARLGNALFHEQQYQKAVDTYRKAVELDPNNATYKQDLKLAEDQLAESRKTVPAGGAAPNPFGMPGFDMSRMSEMMQNPEMMKAAMQMAQNPSFNKMMVDAASHMSGGTPEEQMKSMMEYMRTPDSEGRVRTPMGNMDSEKLRKFQEEVAQRNPKMRAIMEECRASGPDAFYKYMNDPEVVEVMGQMMSMANEEGQGGEQQIQE